MFDTLESRYCPAHPPGILTFGASVLSGHTVLLSGRAMPGEAITFSGVASGATTAGSTGSFSLQTEATALGAVYASAWDAVDQMESVAGVILSTPPPVIMLGLSVNNQGRSVTLSGGVTSNSPSGLTVTFGGQVTGSTVTGADGSYSLTANAGLGAISASAVDIWGQHSNVTQVILSDSGPVVTLSVVQGAYRNVTVTGTVSDPAPADLTVTLGGVVSAIVTTGTGGGFSYTGAASSLGQVTAAVVDPWGLSGSGTTQLTDTAPTIIGFQATYSVQTGTWTFSGQVSAGFAPGSTVTLTGIAGIAVLTVTVGSDGSFSYCIALDQWVTGVAYASATDAWGLTSQTVNTSY
jgi:hypothetical protein